MAFSYESIFHETCTPSLAIATIPLSSNPPNIHVKEFKPAISYTISQPLPFSLPIVHRCPNTSSTAPRSRHSGDPIDLTPLGRTRLGTPTKHRRCSHRRGTTARHRRCRFHGASGLPQVSPTNLSHGLRSTAKWRATLGFKSGGVGWAGVCG